MGDMKNACGTHGSPLKLHTNWLRSFFLYRRQYFNVPVGAPCRQGRSYSHFPGSSTFHIVEKGLDVGHITERASYVASRIE
jgi:hypothetical protein